MQTFNIRRIKSYPTSDWPSGLMGEITQARSWGRIALLVLLSVLLGACSSKVVVVSDVPTPLVSKVPLNASMSFTEQFRNHVYIENERRRALSSLDFADAQIKMFNAVFSALTTLVDPAEGTHDLMIEPEVLDFQYTAPSETKLKQYEVWIKYRIKLLKPDNSKLADWTIKGYGKTPTALLTSATKAFNSAANVALRDVGAQLATRFAGQRKIKELVAAKHSGKAGAVVLSDASLIDASSSSSTAPQIEETSQSDQIANNPPNDTSDAGSTPEAKVNEEPSDE